MKICNSLMLIHLVLIWVQETGQTRSGLAGTVRPIASIMPLYYCPQLCIYHLIICVSPDCLATSTGLYLAYADISILSRYFPYMLPSSPSLASHACTAPLHWSHLWWFVHVWVNTVLIPLFPFATDLLQYCASSDSFLWPLMLPLTCFDSY